MTVIADLRVPPAEFVLAHSLHSVDDAQVEVERVAATGEDHVTPYFWVTADDLDAFDEALREDGTARDPHLLEDNERERLYRVDWHAPEHGVVYAIAESLATLLNASADEEWHVRLLFPDGEALSTFHEYAQRCGLAFDADRLYRPGDPAEFEQYGVTADQREALLAALRAGYFAVPRESNLAAVAAELGISDTALSTRLRRGYANLVRATIAQGEGQGDLNSVNTHG
ncbi:helix-turn-helix domain-containing protein [Halostella litorea]|uniref:helix-turn-helix domain-containing protein n=1 Tax=Halostella litorea TaxID=2528831 RepID=UPI00109334E9|nr:helix-turn-helix domain-containing protein [Halostella litorea]